jgi:hypothetical protein
MFAPGLFVFKLIIFSQGNGVLKMKTTGFGINEPLSARNSTKNPQKSEG